jgi:hypothetical protein
MTSNIGSRDPFLADVPAAAVTMTIAIEYPIPILF